MTLTEPELRKLYGDKIVDTMKMPDPFVEWMLSGGPTGIILRKENGKWVEKIRRGETK